MRLHGGNIIGSQPSTEAGASFSGFNPAIGEALPPSFSEATSEQIDQALSLSTQAGVQLQRLSSEQSAAFLEAIGGQITLAREDLIRRGSLETGLPEARLAGEHARTVNQIKLFAALVREGSWVEARIDRAQPGRQPVPKPEVKRMLVPLGPVAVFGASNFPLAFSVAGGDTISALAAGNPVVVKAHPAHPGTSEIAGEAIRAAVAAVGLPPGVFSMVHGQSVKVGLALVKHPATKAVAFTGSLAGGRALFDAAAARPEPIPVFAEMGSTNPLFVLPGALEAAEKLAQGLIQSVTLGVGQFCTKPGLVFGVNSNAWETFKQLAAQRAADAPRGVMLTTGIGKRFARGALGVKEIPGVRLLAQGGAMVFSTNAATYRQHEQLREELFGPGIVLVDCQSAEDMKQIAAELSGQLTATVHGTDADLPGAADLIGILQQKAGRLVFNGFPTGVEVCPAMHHGGPYPATTAPHFTSVGTAAIARFSRPVCFQNFPDAALPPQLRDRNERNIWRLIDGQLTKEDA